MPVGAQILLVISLPVACGCTVAIQSVGAQKYLMRRVRGIGLVLVDERRRGVLVLVDVIGSAEDAIRPGPHRGPRLDHECNAEAASSAFPKMPSVPATSGSSAFSGTKIVPLPPLCHEIEAVIEELAEEREPRVERRREAESGFTFGKKKTSAVVGGAEYPVQAGARDDLTPSFKTSSLAGRSKIKMTVDAGS